MVPTLQWRNSNLQWMSDIWWPNTGASPKKKKKTKLKILRGTTVHSLLSCLLGLKCDLPPRCSASIQHSCWCAQKPQDGGSRVWGCSSIGEMWMHFQPLTHCDQCCLLGTFEEQTGGCKIVFCVALPFKKINKEKYLPFCLPFKHFTFS